MQFPEYRARRTRRTATLRRLVRETVVTVDDLIYPLFVQEGGSGKEEIPGMPGQYRWSVDRLKEPVKELTAAGISGVLLFGIPKHKDELARGAVNADGIVPRAVRAIKELSPETIVTTDVCVCAYTSHGHCGVLKGKEVDNDASLELLAEMALAHARAGADIVAPSDMMDGRVGFIRETLDEEELDQVGIMAYSAKYASAYYGPFREAAHSSPQFGDRRSYQMDPANVREALREVTLDVSEGADMVMVKPALAYLDVIRAVREEFDLPVVAYNVSGEYAMIKAAAEKGWVDGDQVMLETLTAIKRAGADIILTYHALEAARLLGR
ncbi:MAG: porphobilinogen synthase [Deltaproteobacteria bacterium]|nr:porphobilinogen synthase [Deltaproteobacteria bacterium]